MHHIYHTDAFVLNSRNTGEADSLISFLTRDFGIIFTKATGIRYMKSKLRFSVQKYSYSRIALVRGKGIWRLTNANLLEQPFDKVNNEHFKVLARVFMLLERLVQGEEKDEKLFSTILNAYLYIKDNEVKEIIDFECLLVLRILNILGYIGDNKNIAFFVLENTWNNDVIEKMEDERRDVIKKINNALKESQL